MELAQQLMTATSSARSNVGARVDAVEDAARARVLALAIDPREDTASVHRIAQNAVDRFVDSIAPVEREGAVTRLMATYVSQVLERTECVSRADVAVRATATGFPD